jgi:hypothetical protein
MPQPERLDAEYVLPLRWTDDSGLPELCDYLARLSLWIEVTVVDGSADAAFAAHALAWPAGIRQLRPEPRPGRNGKVAGVMTGVATARHERVVIADDDVRYEQDALRRVIGLLDRAELVRPQNFFLGLPWHARWDTARSLVNRAFGSDYPGTFALRRTPLLAVGGYDGDALFENLELMRTVRAAGGRTIDADGIFVGRIPPRASHFAGQRVRQAYDDFAQPGRLLLEAALLPLFIVLLRRPAALLSIAAVAGIIAELGRRRAGGRAVFETTASLWAPLWLLERAVTVWIAIALRLRGGVDYAGSRVTRAATPARALRARLGSDSTRPHSTRREETA